MFHTIYPIFNGSFNIQFNTVPPMKNIHSFVFLIEDEEGSCTLVDTGFTPQYIPGPKTSAVQNDDHRIDTAIHRMGIDPSRIEQIVMTHIHWDHTAGMHLFPQARFYIQAEDFRGLLSLNPNEETYYCPGHWLPQLPQIELLEGDYQLKPGIRLIFTGGHTKGHQIVEVTTRQGTILLGGDSPFNYDLLWSIIPASDWQAFRQVTGGRFYWDENVMPSVRSWLYDNNHLYQGNHHVLSLEEIKRLGRLITSHNPHLLNVKSIP